MRKKPPFFFQEDEEPQIRADSGIWPVMPNRRENEWRAISLFYLFFSRRGISCSSLSLVGLGGALFPPSHCPPPCSCVRNAGFFFFLPLSLLFFPFPLLAMSDAPTPTTFLMFLRRGQHLFQSGEASFFGRTGSVGFVNSCLDAKRSDPLSLFPFPLPKTGRRGTPNSRRTPSR